MPISSRASEIKRCQARVRHTNTVNVFSDAPVDGAGEIVIHDMQHIDNIESTSGDAGSNHHRTLCGPEGTPFFGGLVK